MTEPSQFWSLIPNEWLQTVTHVAYVTLFVLIGMRRIGADERLEYYSTDA